eukprot:4418978-Pyramimonas_sp.AAC.1
MSLERTPEEVLDLEEKSGAVPVCMFGFALGQGRGRTKKRKGDGFLFVLFFFQEVNNCFLLPSTILLWAMHNVLLYGLQIEFFCADFNRNPLSWAMYETNPIVANYNSSEKGVPRESHAINLYLSSLHFRLCFRPSTPKKESGIHTVPSWESDWD